MNRIVAMIVKEMWAVLRDPKSRVILIVPPLLQLFIFSYSTTLEVRHVDVGVYDRSGGAHATELVSRIAGSPTFRRLVRLRSPDEVREAIGDQQVIAAIVIDPDFDRNIDARKPTSIGVILDGRRSNAAQIVSSYLSRIAAGIGADAMPRGQRNAEGSVVTNWYNPSLEYVWFTLPSLIAIVVSVGGLAVTSQTVARERELGTFDQLMVSPLHVHEILIGKMVPPLLIGLLNATVYVLIIAKLFGVPLTGSVPFFYLALIFYLLALIGVGMLVSAVSQTQQQAFLGAFLVMVPAILLSGYATTVDNMPAWLQIVAEGDPSKHFLIVSEGVFLKAMPATEILLNTWPLAVIAAVTLTASSVLFRSRME